MVSLKGKVQTVCGVIHPAELGITLMHEHFFIDCRDLVEGPSNPRELELSRLPVHMGILGWLKFNHFKSFDNMILSNEKALASEAMSFRGLGGGTIVDLTPPDIGRDAVGLQRLSRLTGLNIVCGTAHYLHSVHPSDMSFRSVNELQKEFVGEIFDEIGKTGVKAGIIGEIGNSSPWHENEKKCCAAAARAQHDTGAPISIHLGRTPGLAFAISKLLKQEGADPNRVVMGHAETRLGKISDLEALAAEGHYVEFDAFGLDHLPVPENPSDEDKVRKIRTLIDDGYLDRILISHDVCLKTQLKMYGGYGYSHILENIVPILRKEGISERETAQILVDNPRRILSFA